jgi:hypothetical protein
MRDVITPRKQIRPQHAGGALAALEAAADFAHAAAKPST